MAGLKPVAVYGLNVPCGDDPVEAESEGRATFRITMAAIDPTAKPKSDQANGEIPALATLKMIRVPGFFDDDDDDDSDDEDYDIAQLLNGASDDDEDMEEEEGAESSDDADDSADESSAAMKKAAINRIKKAVAGEENSESADAINGDLSKLLKDNVNGQASDGESDEDEELDLDEDYDEPDVYVLCTLDPKKNYQQTLDITINHDEQVFFLVTGAYNVTLTGNYLIPEQDDPRMYPIDDDEEYDLSPDEDEEDTDMLYGDEESDDLDDLADPRRITEMDDSDTEQTQALKPKTVSDKSKNKRAADDAEELQLSKKQLKKLKKNNGTVADISSEDQGAAVKPLSAKSDKKVQFAKDLEQGPSSSPKTTISGTQNTKAETNGDKLKAGLGVKIVKGVTVDDKKLGSGPAAKSGNKVSMRYIGKLESNKKVFDSNKKGKPFSFQLGKKEVIQGWDIGVEGMAVGGERRITIPAHLAYGKKGAAPDIPPNSTLIFDVKMLEIK